MTKGEEPHSEMVHARQNDGINVIFDQNSPASSRSRSRSSSASSRSSGSGRHRGRDSHRGRPRSPSSSSSSSSSSTCSSSSRSSSRSRSRSYPRCHRPSSRCRCDDHRRYGRGRQHRSPPRRYRARSRSYSRTPSRFRYSGRRRYRARSRSSGRSVSRFQCRFSKSPARTYRYRSRSRSSGRSLGLSLNEKRELLEAAKANAMKILGVEKVELPESVKSILPEQSESKWVSPEARVRQDPEKTLSQSNEVEPDISSPKRSPKRRIAFSTHNSVAKPTLAPSSGARVTPRVDSYESRKPYGHWIPVKPVQTSNAR